MRAQLDRSAAVGAAVAAAAGALSFAAFFLARGTALGPLVWIGGFALLAAALATVRAPRLAAEASVFIWLLAALAVWCGFTMLWSVSPDTSWQYTNRTLVYVAFALLGALVASYLRNPGEWVARGAALLLALVLGWALLAKCVPSLYSDYGRLARLRAPVDYWNELALLAVVTVPVALWLASRRYTAGALLLFGAGLTVLLTYSRFGIALACLAAVAWLVLGEDRVGGLAAVLLSGGAAGAVFGVALALPGVTKDGQPHSVRVHDGRLFALAIAAGAVIVFAGAMFVQRLPVPERARLRIERAAGLAGTVLAAGAVIAAIVFAGRIWHAFANPVSSQITSSTGHITSLNSSNRWRWWQEAWHAFTHHPGGGTGAGTFRITDAMLRRSPLTTTEPHNVPLQFLSETGIVGLLLFAAAAVAAVIGVLRARARTRGAERAAVTALAIGAAAFLVHLVADTDWDYLAVCGPLLFVAGALVAAEASPQAAPRRRPLIAVGAVLLALGAIYSLGAPWFAQRRLETATTLAQVKRAHAYDPLSTDALTEWAAFEEVADPVRAAQLYRDAVSLEPENATVWFEYGDFFWDEGLWQQAYLAYNASWHDDRFGPAGVPCGRLDQARHKVLGVWPPSCPGGRPAAPS